MAKRKLTKRQAWRVEKIQQEKAKRAERKENDIAEQLNAGELGDECHGQVIAHFGTQVEIEDGQRQKYRCYLRANLGSLVTGDRVVFRRARKSIMPLMMKKYAPAWLKRLLTEHQNYLGQTLITKSNPSQPISILLCW